MLDGMKKGGVSPFAGDYGVALTVCERADDEQAEQAATNLRNEMRLQSEGRRSPVEGYSKEVPIGVKEAWTDAGPELAAPSEEGTEGVEAEHPARAAIAIFDRLEGRGITRDIVTYSLAITAYGQ